MNSKLDSIRTKISTYKEYLIVYLLLFVSFIILLPKTGHAGDFNSWYEWTKYIFAHGLGNAYKSGTNYLPLYQYFMFLFGKIQGSEEYILRYIFYLKIFAIIFDFITGFFLLRLIQEHFKDTNRTFIYSLFLFLNIAYIYNSLIWGQVDGIMTCFIFLAFFFAYKRKVSWSLLFIVLSLNFKLQSIIYIPLLGLMLLSPMIKQFSFKKLGIWLALILSIQALIILPFWLKGDLEKIWGVVTHSIDGFPFISMNAYNFWYWFFKSDLMLTYDTTMFLGITCKHWGQGLFYVTSAIALFPLMKDVFLMVFYKQSREISLKKSFVIGALIPLLFFFLNTQMHERYSHPAIIFLAGYALIYKRYFPYILGSIAYFLNLEGVLQYMHLKNYGTALFHPAFVALLFFICIVSLFFDLYGITFYTSKKTKKFLLNNG